jgi:hypothetical protein
VASSEATKPSGIRARDGKDLLREEATAESSWRRGYRALRHIVCLRRRRWRSSEAARIARRWCQRLGFARGARGERGASEGLDWVGLTDPGPGPLG